MSIITTPVIDTASQLGKGEQEGERKGERDKEIKRPDWSISL